MSIQLGFFSFHLYGFLIGLSVLVGFFLIEKKSEKVLENVDLSSLLIWIMIPAIIGARIYHLLTDFPLYQNNWIEIFYFWRGGLGIIGGVIGGGLGAYFYLRKNNNLSNLDTILDLSIFGLPVGQAIGRWGNFVNQELYGLPTDLPWSIRIDEAHRLADFKSFEKYHPLFFYESAFLFIFWLIVIYLDKKGLINKYLSIGSGKLFLFYSIYYLIVRFWLEFLRLDKNLIALGMSLNQFIIVGLLILIFIYYSKKHSQKN